MATSTGRITLLPGTLDMLILRALRWEPTHGWGVADWIRTVTGNAFELEEGTFYPALKRLEQRGLIESERGRSDTGRQAKFYTLTPAGRRALQELLASWSRYTAAVDRAIRHGNPVTLWGGAGTQGPAIRGT